MKRGWKVGLGVALILIILIVLLLFFSPARQILVYSVPLCNTRMERVIEALVKKDFPGFWSDIFTSAVAEVMAVNDMRCESEAYMANSAIILEEGRKTLFGIFHIHFSHEGKFISSAPVTPWKQYPDRNDPKIDAVWQDFIKKVYPEQTVYKY